MEFWALLPVNEIVSALSFAFRMNFSFSFFLDLYLFCVKSKNQISISKKVEKAHLKEHKHPYSWFLHLNKCLVWTFNLGVTLC